MCILNDQQFHTQEFTQIQLMFIDTPVLIAKKCKESKYLFMKIQTQWNITQHWKRKTESSSNNIE